MEPPLTSIITLSIGLELGWGVYEMGKYNHLSDTRTAETQALHRLPDLADNHEPPITFDIVGYLLHQSCTGHHGGPYPDGYWTEDPGSNQETDPIFYAPDLVNKIQDRHVTHKFATHTYLHLLIDEASSELLPHEQIVSFLERDYQRRRHIESFKATDTVQIQLQQHG